MTMAATDKGEYNYFYRHLHFKCKLHKSVMLLLHCVQRYFTLRHGRKTSLNYPQPNNP